jgi:hypothetical protein
MPAYWSGSSVPSGIPRSNRSGGGVGTSPGINPITPYTTASLDYRASWIAGEMMAKTSSATKNANIAGALWSETLGNESRAAENSVRNPAKRFVLPPPTKHAAFLESSGLERSLSTNIPDHPTAIQVNGLRQERTEHVMCPGHVFGIGSYDSRVLCGNWAEERSDKSYVPSVGKASTGNDWQWSTTYRQMTENLADKVLPAPGTNAETMYTHPSSIFATGVKEESKSSNAENVALGGDGSGLLGDPRSVSRKPGNYVSYQCGRQHLISQMGGRISELPPYETTTQAGFTDPANKPLPTSSERQDLYKPPFMIRDPGRDGKSKMLCGVKSKEFACDDDSEEYLTTHILGKPVKGKQKAYTVEEYRRLWTKNDPEVKAAGQVDTSEHRARFPWPDLSTVDATRKMPGHVGSWH